MRIRDNVGMATIGIDARLWNWTGIGRYIRNLVSNLVEIDKKNQYVLFACPQDINDIKSTVTDDKVIIIPTDIKWHSVKEQLEFPRLLNKYNLDLVHFPYFSVPVFYKRPFVVTVHDLIINHFSTGKASTLPLPLYKIKRAGYGFVLKRAIHDARKVVVPSIATKKEIEKEYMRDVKPGNIIVTQEGVDENIIDFKPEIFKDKNPYFLYVGNAYPHKNVEKLLEAFSLFTENHPEYLLKLVGKKDFFYKKLEGKTKQKNVEFLGFVPDSDLANLYKNAVATVIPSLMEGFGLPALEAMSCGSVVLASDIPALQEVCENDALYFSPQDTLSIVKGMGMAADLGDKEKNRLISEGKKHAEKYSWKKTAELTLNVYNSCLNT